MASRKVSDQILEWLAARGVTRVTETVFAEVAAAFPDRKARALRQGLRECGLRLDPIVEGVRQNSLEELARTLIALQHLYQEGGDQQQIRSLVIESKNHARLASLKRPEKLEMIEWMLVWLHDPSLFEVWARLRLLSLGKGATGGLPNPDAGQTDKH